MESKVWFITGASSGFGKGVLEKILANGDSAIAVSRNTTVLEMTSLEHKNRVLVLRADVRVTKDVDSAVEKGLKQFGKIDVLLNNAGQGLFWWNRRGQRRRTAERLRNKFLGAMRVIRAMLPSMRQRGKGHIIKVSSAVGHASTPSAGTYAATNMPLRP